MIGLPELKAVLRDNGVSGYAYLNKSEIIALLQERGLLHEALKKWEEKPVKREKYDLEKYAYLRDIRNNPKPVEIRDQKTNIVAIYPSLYKARRESGICLASIRASNGRVYKGRYEIKIL